MRIHLVHGSAVASVAGISVVSSYQDVVMGVPLSIMVDESIEIARGPPDGTLDK